MIRIFVASNDKWADVEPVLEYSILKNTALDPEEIQINIIRPHQVGMQPSGCTSFTNVRFAVPELAGFDGFAIYLDVDMLVLGDIQELWSYRKLDEWRIMENGSTEVAVIDCSHPWGLPAKEELHRFKKWHLDPRVPYTRAISWAWNVTDRLEEGANLIHFTGLDHQPWDNDKHPNPDAAALWWEYWKQYKETVKNESAGTNRESKALPGQA